jgi:hypothetical protein
VHDPNIFPLSGLFLFQVVGVKGVLGAQGQVNLLQDVNDHVQKQQLWS